MMPWTRRRVLEQRIAELERRDSSYTDVLVASLTANASGETTAFPTATAALEACSGLVGRAFASAAVSAPDAVREALTPDFLALLGRALIRRGELVALVDVRDGRLMLWPASSHDIDGSYDAWTYRLNMAGPGEQATREQLPAGAVVHVRYASDPETPWRGYGPLQVAQLAGRLSAETTAALADEASMPRGAVLPMPVDGQDPTIEALKADIKKLRGRLAFVESTKNRWHSDDTRSGARDDWMMRRIGAEPPASMVSLAEHATMEVIIACGFSPALFAATGDGTARREAFRQVLHTVVQPLARLVETELSEKLEAEVTLSFDSLFAADLSGRARAFQSLVGGGMDPAKAAALAGLMEAE